MHPSISGNRSPSPPPIASTSAAAAESASHSQPSSSQPASSGHLGLESGSPPRTGTNQPNTRAKLPKKSVSTAETTVGFPEKFSPSGTIGLNTIATFPPHDRKSVIYKRFANAILKVRAELSAGVLATVDLGAIRRNYRKGLDKLNPNVEAGAVVKANGYGLGAVKIAKTLIEEGCRTFFVARMSEAVELRQSLRAEGNSLAEDIKICVLDGFPAGTDPHLMLENKLTPVLNTLDSAKAFNAIADRSGVEGKLPCILQFDTGMSRAGMSSTELDALKAEGGPAAALDRLNVTHIMTHLANAGDATAQPGASNDESRISGADSQAQLAEFERICEHFPDAKYSIGASSTVFLEPSYHKDMVRMGGTFHGQAPFDAATNPLEPTLTLTAGIAELRDIPKGARIGYGLAFTAPHAMKIAVLRMGYADGLPRKVNGNRPGDPQPAVHVLVEGKHRAPLVGAISMDMITIDVTNVPEADLTKHTRVTIVGRGRDGAADITPDDLGSMFDTNASETQTKLSSRVHMRYVDEAPAPSTQS